jgi:GR25 family glycosyltransferase involved in LPS biosynthesis
MDYRAIPAFCINLDSRPDRWAQAAEQFATLGWPVTRQPGVTYAQSPYPTLSAAQAGCLESHKEIWRQCIASAHDIIAVFEDDVLFSPRFKDIFAPLGSQLPAAWDAWLLHSFRARCSAFSADLVRLTGAAWGTHGYLVTRGACHLLLTLPDDAPADSRLTRGLLSQSKRVFGTRRLSTLAFQRGDDSDIPGTAQPAFWRQQRARFFR